ncbi:MAG: small multi-drug export protein [Clostridia bacterium]|nr:small multi-drug export protein [Clostridia bacterium]MBR5742550.1 small multi-drug export protein [Clostridia bacterium]
MFWNCLKEFFVAMLPIVELRGAIPYALAMDIPLKIAFPIAILGNMFPVPFILLFFDKAKVWFRNVPLVGKVFAWVDKRAAAKAKGITRLEFLAIILFVAIPLPGTGAWTGSVIATALGMKLRKSIPAVLIGVLIAGLVVSLLSYGLWGYIVSLFQ